MLGSRESIRLGVMLALLALNVAAELVSFSRVIDAVPPLRWFDRVGKPTRAARTTRYRYPVIGVQSVRSYNVMRGPNSTAV